METYQAAKALDACSRMPQASIRRSMMKKPETDEDTKDMLGTTCRMQSRQAHSLIMGHTTEPCRNPSAPGWA